MANRTLFSSRQGRQVPAATTENLAGGIAYEMGIEHQLAQVATTGTFGDTYYMKPETQLEEVLEAGGATTLGSDATRRPCSNQVMFIQSQTLYLHKRTLGL